MSGPDRLKPPFSESLLLLGGYYRGTAVDIMQIIIKAASLGERRVDDVLFAGIDGSDVISSGSFGDTTKITAVTFSEWAEDAACYDRSKTKIGNNPYHAALDSGDLPTILVLRKSMLKPCSTPGKFMHKGIVSLGRAGSLFDQAVASMVYIAENERRLNDLEIKTGIRNDLIYRPEPRSIFDMPFGVELHLAAEKNVVS